MNSIELKNVTKRLKGNTVLDDITFTFESGNIYGLYGRNASGKTMLLRAIAGLIYPNSGEVRIHDDDVGVGLEELVLLELAVVGVDDGEGAAGCVRGGDGGADDHGSSRLVGHGLGRVKYLAASDAHHDVAAGPLHDGRDAVDLLPGALAVEDLKLTAGL